MANGKLLADQIQHSSAGTVDTTYVVQGSNKVYYNVDQTAGSILKGSLNVSGATDNSTGDFTVNFTNSLNSVDDVAAPIGSRNFALQIHDTLITTSSIELYSRNQTPAVNDQNFNTGALVGVLA